MLVSLLAASCALAQGGTATDPRLIGAAREERAGWIVARLHGSPSQIGYQYGYLMAPEIDDAFNVLRGYLKQTTQKDWDYYRQTSKAMFWPKVDREYKQELLGIAEGMRAKGYKYDSNDLLAENSFLDIAWYYLPYLEDKKTQGKAESKAPPYCSAFVATGSQTRDGKVVMAHEAWIDYVLGSRWNLVLDVKPDHGNRFIMDTFAGFIHSGDDFAINSAGILVTETTIGGFKGFKEDGVPEFVRARKAVQYSNSIDDFARIMTAGNNGGYANTWLIADNKDNEIGKLELGLKNVILKRSSNGVFYGSNFAEDAKLIAEECAPGSDAIKMCVDRRTRWARLMKDSRGKVDAEMAKAFLADHHDEVLNKDGASATTLCGHFDEDPRPGICQPLFTDLYPGGSVQGKVTTSDMAKSLSFWARLGHPCGQPFLAQPYLAKHPDYAWTKPYLKDMPTQPWTIFAAR